MLTICHVYPELLGTYGDAGNVEVLRRRMERRGLPAHVAVVHQGDELPKSAGLLVLGGGEDDAQRRLAPLIGELLSPAIADGAVVLAVCAGLQLLGHTLETSDGQVVEGAGLLDVATVRSSRRAVGEVVAVSTGLPLGRLTGFVNHGGATTLGGRARPLGRVRRGPANSPLNRHEGAVQGRVIGTYLHGPVLARNPRLADHLLQVATGQDLEPLPDREIAALRRERLGRQRIWRR